MRESMNILIVGVGGQGTLLASRLMGKVFADAGFDVKVSEVHGMSQRGGSVVTYVRYGEKVWSPLIDRGEADVMVCFEELEAARWLPYLKKNGTLITSTQNMDPMPVIMGDAVYPEKISEKIASMGVRTIAFDAVKYAEQAGTIKAVNLVLLGAFAKAAGWDKEVWHEAVKATVPPKTVDVNLKAFDLGYNN